MLVGKITADEALMCGVDIVISRNEREDTIELLFISKLASTLFFFRESEQTERFKINYSEFNENKTELMRRQSRASRRRNLAV